MAEPPTKDALPAIEETIRQLPDLPVLMAAFRQVKQSRKRQREESEKTVVGVTAEAEPRSGGTEASHVEAQAE